MGSNVNATKSQKELSEKYKQALQHKSLNRAGQVLSRVGRELGFVMKNGEIVKG